MGTLFIHMLQSAGCLLFFFLFYKVLLSNETFHRFNRLALMGIALLSLFLPIIPLNFAIATPVGQVMVEMESRMLSDVQVQIVTNHRFSDYWPLLLVSLYLAGIIVFWVGHLYSFIRMYQLIANGRKEVLFDGIRLIIHQKKVSAFSWMHYIVISESDYLENGKVILTHEKAHIQSCHSWDLLIANCLLSLQWFNPAAWLWKRELQNIHEFEADEWVIRQGVDAKKYQLLLIKKAVGTRLYSMANSFNHSSLKKRITMMVRKKSNPWARAKYLYVLPLATVAAVAFARPEVSSSLDEISSVKVNDLSEILKADESNNTLISQQAPIKVSGQVLDDATGQPLQGATVIIQNTNRGTITDKEGRFSLEVSTGDVLCFSFVGAEFKKIEVTKEMPAQLQVRLKELSEQIEEIEVGSQSETSQVAQQKEVSSQTSAQKKSVGSNDEDTFMVVEEMPEYPGGMSNMMKFVASHIKYPIEAVEKKIEGRVIASFIVQTDGTLANIEIVRSPSPILSKEAKRVIGLMPAWKPGKQRGKAVNVKFTVPISFKLPVSKSTAENDVSNQALSLKVDANTTQEDINELKNYLRSSVQKVNVSVANKETVAKKASAGEVAKALILVDGKVFNGNLNNIDPNTIASIEVIKDPAKTQKYGGQAKNGVIIVKLKENK